MAQFLIERNIPGAGKFSPQQFQEIAWSCWPDSFPAPGMFRSTRKRAIDPPCFEYHVRTGAVRRTFSVGDLF